MAGEPVAPGDDVWLFPAHIEAARQLASRWSSRGRRSSRGHRPHHRATTIRRSGPSRCSMAAAFVSTAASSSTGMVRESMRDPRYKDRQRSCRWSPSIWSLRCLRGWIPGGSPLLTALTELRRWGSSVYVFLPPLPAPQTVFETSPTWQSFWRAYHLDLPARLRAIGIACLPLFVPQERWLR